jgi:hypothetical protein
MNTPDPKKIARMASISKTAGEVRFVKDRSGDAKEWAWAAPGASERKISENFIFNAKELKPLALTLRSSLMALGHVTSAHARFVKVKSRNVSPDGALGGMGYVQKIPDMRRQLMNCIEVLSAITDTLYDEIHAPHWHPAEDTLTPRDREEVKQIVEESADIKDDPENWAVEEEEEDLEEIKESVNKSVKTASKSVPVIDYVIQDILDSVKDLELEDPEVYAKVARVLSKASSVLSEMKGY